MDRGFSLVHRIPLQVPSACVSVVLLMDTQEYHLYKAKAIFEERAIYGDTQHPLSRGPVVLGLHVQEGIPNPEACVHIDCGSISTFGLMYFPLVLYCAG